MQQKLNEIEYKWKQQFRVNDAVEVVIFLQSTVNISAITDTSHWQSKFPIGWTTHKTNILLRIQS